MFALFRCLVLLAGMSSATFSAAGTLEPSPAPQAHARLQALSSIEYDALKDLEARHHKVYSEDEILTVMATPEFFDAFEQSLHRFCTKPENRGYLACTQPQV
ncbi:hypothetical protein KTD31_01555 [Burkholderia multivorans]|uniref:hypothetical protein n=1 Tax=Burkholderia multivorans TaxID=87883 RepID=UPI001C211465|nr:hypothetical protein [Burkholderia multivorans]MBU9200088.1 hypothetical protein [Burkholderia multivorans]